MLNKLKTVVAAVRWKAGVAMLSFAAIVAGATSANAAGTATPIAAVTSAIDFTDLQTDLTAFMTALLGLVLVLVGFRLGISWLRKLA